MISTWTQQGSGTADGCRDAWCISGKSLYLGSEVGKQITLLSQSGSCTRQVVHPASVDTMLLCSWKFLSSSSSQMYPVYMLLYYSTSEAVSLILWHFKWFLFASLPSDCAFSYDPSLPICFLKYQWKLIETFNVISRTENTVIKACWDVSLLWSHTFQQKYLLAWGGYWWEKIWE